MRKKTLLLFALLLLAPTARGTARSASQADTTAAYAWRGCMIDVSRHFFPTSFLRRQVDVMQRYGLNRLHLHLTDAGGWRMEIKAYPELTQRAAYRTQEDWDTWWNGGDRRYTATATGQGYGGFFRQGELRDLVAYAEARGVTVVPEIEMPGHSEEVMAAYPELKCEGNAEAQGDFCPANPQTYVFLEQVLAEVMQVFPSEYIHLGGDEAGMSSWRSCPRCQDLMRQLGTTDPAELQAVLVRRMTRYLQAHGRKAIVWDEALTDSLPRGTAIMVWRNAARAKEAIRKGYDVIMTPTSHCYLDYYQDAPTYEPRAIGGFLPLETVYAFDPQAGLTADEGRHVLGLQGNLWTEYIPTEAHAEHMLYPRLFALAQIGRQGATRPPYTAFRREALREVRRLQREGYHPFDLKREHGVRPEARKTLHHKAVGSQVAYAKPYSPYYPAGGATALVDGQCGGWTHGDGTWQGFCGDSCLDLTIDLNRPTRLHSVSLEFLQCSGAWIYLPAWLTLSTSDDGHTFSPLLEVQEPRTKNEGTHFKTYRWRGKRRARYLRVQAAAPGRGEWIFTDEVVVH